MRLLDVVDNGQRVPTIRRHMNLPDYIKAVGHESAASLFGVSKWAVKSWRFGERRPRPDKAHEIEALTNGLVRFAEIYPRPDKDNND